MLSHSLVFPSGENRAPDFRPWWNDWLCHRTETVPSQFAPCRYRLYWLMQIFNNKLKKIVCKPICTIHTIRRRKSTTAPGEKDSCWGVVENLGITKEPLWMWVILGLIIEHHRRGSAFWIRFCFPHDAHFLERPAEPVWNPVAFLVHVKINHAHSTHGG